ncbi:MAG TPA: hypothetical protein VHZ97_14065 [Pseudonocardiaceae bacterium]|jgi:sugar phosphate permease|nr:hypothetical protein [Pseudonocardiaceae bacterium]
MGRLLTLYLRSRHVPIALPAAIVVVAALSWLGDNPRNPMETVIFAVLALALGLSVLGNGFSGADPALERTGSIRWPLWRAVHALAMGLLLFGTVALVSHAPVGMVARDAVGLVGLAGLAAALFGGQLAWTLPILWAGAAAVVPPVTTPAVLALLTWPTQAPDSASALVVALVLGLGGVFCYAQQGRSRRS